MKIELHETALASSCNYRSLVSTSIWVQVVS